MEDSRVHKECMVVNVQAEFDETDCLPLMDAIIDEAGRITKWCCNLP